MIKDMDYSLGCSGMSFYIQHAHKHVHMHATAQAPMHLPTDVTMHTSMHTHGEYTCTHNICTSQHASACIAHRNINASAFKHFLILTRSSNERKNGRGEKKQIGRERQRQSDKVRSRKRV